MSRLLYNSNSNCCCYSCSSTFLLLFFSPKIVCAGYKIALSLASCLHCSIHTHSFLLSFVVVVVVSFATATRVIIITIIDRLIGCRKPNAKPFPHSNTSMIRSSNNNNDSTFSLYISSKSKWKRRWQLNELIIINKQTSWKETRAKDWREKKWERKREKKGGKKAIDTKKPSVFFFFSNFIWFFTLFIIIFIEGCWLWPKLDEGWISRLRAAREKERVSWLGLRMIKWQPERELCGCNWSQSRVLKTREEKISAHKKRALACAHRWEAAAAKWSSLERALSSQLSLRSINRSLAQLKLLVSVCALRVKQLSWCWRCESCKVALGARSVSSISASQSIKCLVCVRHQEARAKFFQRKRHKVEQNTTTTTLVSTWGWSKREKFACWQRREKKREKQLCVGSNARKLAKGERSWMCVCCVCLCAWVCAGWEQVECRWWPMIKLPD